MRTILTEARPLNVTQEGHHRIFVGLGWDPNEQTGLLHKAKSVVKGQETHHDLDLSCYIYDAQKRYIGHVSAEAERGQDQTGKIYHSGDNVEGIGEGDDEQISVELLDLDPVIHSLVFKASIKSGHVFGDIQDPEIRIVDGYSNHTFLRQNMNCESGADKDAYIFLHVLRAENGWMMRHINCYIPLPGDAQWGETLKAYL